MIAQHQLTVTVTQDPFDVGREVEALKQGRTDIGAICTFTGTVRDLTGSLKALTLEHYPGMTERDLNTVAAEARNRFDLLGLTVIHRYGRLEPGQDIVLVVAAAPHRQNAFDGAMYMMDHLKTRAAFWKKEEHDGGQTEWVASRTSDTDAAARWSNQGQDVRP